MTGRWVCPTTTGSAPPRNGTPRSCMSRRRIVASGDIYLGHYEGWYAVRDEAYYDRGRTDHSAGRHKDRAERLRRCSGSASHRISFGCPPGGSAAELYEDNPEFIAPASRRAEVISFVRGGLHDMSASRTTMTWGVPIPDAAWACHVCLDRRADQLHQPLAVSGRGRAALAFSGRLTRTSLARTYPVSRSLLAGFY